MAEQLLDRIRAEIRERLKESEAAVREYERLERALEALGGQVDAEPGSRGAEASAPRRRGRAKTRAGSAKRAPRGANREAVLRVLGERPGVSVNELSAASGVDRPVLYNLLKTLEARGEIAKEQLPGGNTGYRLAESARSGGIEASGGAGAS
jgi:hypothetical protein